MADTVEERELAAKALETLGQLTGDVFHYLDATKDGADASESSQLVLSSATAHVIAIFENERIGNHRERDPLLSEEFRLLWGAWERCGGGPSWCKLGNASIFLMLADVRDYLQILADNPHFAIGRNKLAELFELVRVFIEKCRTEMAEGGQYDRPVERTL